MAPQKNGRVYDSEVKCCKKCYKVAQSGLLCANCGTLSHSGCLKQLKSIKYIDDETVICCEESVRLSDPPNKTLDSEADDEDPRQTEISDGPKTMARRLLCKQVFYEASNTYSNKMKDEETTVNPPSNFQNNLIQQGTVSMFHVNLQCISNKVDMINAFLADKKFYDVICFSEHWQTEENLKLINISGFSLANFFCRVEKKQGGVAIYVKENLMYSSLNLNEYNVEQTSEFCAIYIPSMRTNVLTVYRSGNGDCDLFLVNFENVIAFLLNKADKLIILGDFNINFKIKSDSSYDIQNLLMSFGLEITINDYTRITSQSSSCIDNIMTNFSENIYRVGVFEPCFSDHRAQFISIDSDLKVVDTNQSLQRSITSSGLQKLKYALASTKMDFFYDTNNDPDVLMFFLTETYNNLILKFFPLKKVRQTAKITPVQWFNDELRSYRSNLSLIKHMADVTKDPDIFKLYKQQKYEYNRQLQNAKKSAYSGFITNSNNKPRDCWKILNFERGNTRSSSVQPDLSPDEINQFFITIAENIITSLPTINNDILFSYRNYPSPSKSFCFRPVVEDEISQIIKSLNNSNCKDVHEINSKILKETHQIVLTPFTHLINLILSTGVFPEALKYSKDLWYDKTTKGGQETLYIGDHKNGDYTISKQQLGEIGTK
ncbi:uncharacterized protein LOC114333711 [Diabrotica virgifera virgifera]|uniref:Endonuclease/exonuclease/phosphatase domain-containing protein n=1 Tax=Diabrotica virgifera virgifera TaxID=50390 RepID=A0ABM5KFD4_DIAVI|nr:uncharacterized protein LOC114333711 [Diabrotica virgifera virgifera]